MSYGLQLYDATGKSILDTNVDRVFRIEEQINATSFKLINYSTAKNTQAFGDCTYVTLVASWTLPDISYEGMAFCPALSIVKATPCVSTTFSTPGLRFVLKGADHTLEDCYDLIKNYMYVVRY